MARLDTFFTGIKCDSCTWRDDSVKQEDYKDWLNKPCPECGYNLLTDKDYSSVKRVEGFTKVFNFLFGWTEYIWPSKTVEIRKYNVVPRK